jgi:hypothetical protein
VPIHALQGWAYRLRVPIVAAALPPGVRWWLCPTGKCSAKIPGCAHNRRSPIVKACQVRKGKALRTSNGEVVNHNPHLGFLLCLSLFRLTSFST